MGENPKPDTAIVLLRSYRACLVWTLFATPYVTKSAGFSIETALLMLVYAVIIAPFASFPGMFFVSAAYRYTRSNLIFWLSAYYGLLVACFLVLAITRPS